MSSIHPTAQIADGASIADDVEIGPYCVVGEHVSLAAGVKLISHVCVDGHTQVGSDVIIYPFASIGHAPQDLKYHGEPSTLSIGAHTTIREHVTMNPGTEGGAMETVVGEHCLFMMGSHVAHDCVVGNHVILANNATLAGHVHVGDHAIIGGLAAIHQFVRVGEHAIIGGMSGVENDVIPYGSVLGERAYLAGLNIVGMRRRGFTRETIHALRNAYKQLFTQDQDTLLVRSTQVQKTFGEFPEVQRIIDFMGDKGSRALCTPKRAA